MWRLADLPIRWRITAGPLGALLGLALVAVSVYSGLTVVRQAEALDQQTREVLRHAASAQGAFHALQSTLSTYALTADPALLAAFQAARAEQETEIAVLRALVADHPGQLARLDRLDALLQTWHAEV